MAFGAKAAFAFAMFALCLFLSIIGEFISVYQLSCHCWEDFFRHIHGICQENVINIKII